MPGTVASAPTSVLLALFLAHLVLAAALLVLLTRWHDLDHVGALATLFAVIASGGSVLANGLILLRAPESGGVLWWATIVSGLAALAGALALTALVPRLLRLPSAKLLEEQVRESQVALRELERVQSSLQETIKLRTSELSETRQRFETTLRKTPVFISNQDRELRYTWVRNPPAQISGDDILGHSDEDVFPPETAKAVIAAKRSVMERGDPGRIELVLEKDDEPRWYDIGIDPLLDQRGNIVGVTTVALDVTHRKRNEEHLKGLLREVTHRAKNLLAVISAISRQTASRAGTKEDFVERFAARIQSLSRAHDLLVRREWWGVSLRELIHSELGDDENLVGTRIMLEGPELILGPEATHNVGLAIHELWHNATTFGALSTPHGSVDISWRLEHVGEERRVVLRWEEHDGPAVRSAERTGFGRMFLETALSRTLAGGTNLEFRDTGIVCEITISGYHVLE